MKFLKPIAITIVLVLLAIWIRADESMFVRPFCPFHKVFGIPCPGCGGVRAVYSLMRGDIADALNINPVAILFAFACVGVVACFWIDAFFDTKIIKKSFHTPWSPILTIVVLSIIFANWIWSISKGL